MNSRQAGSRMTPVEPADSIEASAVRLGNRLLRLLPTQDAPWIQRLTDAIDALLGTKHDLFFHKIDVTSGAELPTDPGAVFTTEFWLPPDPEIGVILVDMNVTEHWLETLLDDEPPRERRLAPVTPRDFGLISFVLLHAVDALRRAGFPPVTLSTEPPRRAEALSAVGQVERIVEVVFGVTSARSAGLIRLFLPGGMVQSLESFSRPSERAAAGLDRIARAYPELDVPFTLSLGYSMLTPSEVDFLGVGDLVFPTSHSLDIEGVDGRGRVVVLGHGFGSKWGWSGSVSVGDTGKWHFSIHRHTQKQEDDMTQEVAEEDQTEMIERANVRVEFRLGDITLPIAELAELQSGYVLETDRDVGDGVDIVASGRKVASGELVSVDGRLGIRVVSLDR